MRDAEICGVSLGSWYGSDPEVVDRLDHSNTFEVTGYDSGFTISVPPGVTLSGSGEQRSLSLSLDYAAFAVMEFTAVRASGLLDGVSQISGSGFLIQGVYGFHTASAGAEFSF